MSEFNEKVDSTIQKAKEYAGEAKKATEKVINIQKLKIEAATLKSKLNHAYEQFGKTMYEQLEEYPQETQEVISLIEEYSARLEKIEVEIGEVKGKPLCPICGKPVEEGMAYCPYCGKQIN
ncbi:MAG: zinc-ribbon domain-containing protein [Oscillospiraceae bacterium]|nr:zinc-ribbon domain-containing protein [Candidatus Equicaccousia limihippi]